MLKKEITYENPFTAKEVTETHYFHISKADLVEMEMEENKATYTDKTGVELTGMQAKLQRIVDSEDGKAIMAEFKDIIRRAYGKKEGDRFLKSREISEEFMASEACSQLIFEICTNANASADFVNGIIPNNLEQIAAGIRKEAEEIERAEAESTPAEPVTNGNTPSGDDARKQEIAAATSENPVLLSRNEIIDMSDEEFRSGLAEGRYKLS